MKLLKLQQVMEKTSLCSSSIYNLMKEGDFPKNISVMGKRKAWLESEVEEWVMARIEERDITLIKEDD
ncbi:MULTISPECIES: AlpA family phage regulatory protein [unclassified Salinivibrio]|uniref:AlpA family phage regulatory protein n=1 Tax=unclassified Salinivibrio TaxID=2636825 RepID=UPI000985D00F|nr:MULTISPECIES: AlpA family phage regulatory protein [unclassified Salinivibrio]MPS32626.1 AlpA family phage regulatory protein [Salinivibrio sp. VYel7]MPX94017.1 AlpA family phage regulatory protein [Salinivibrio sp. VYel9]MPY00123.1 AlpA family phage regulatory protein [Salinivibrio sp. VYel4]MPY03191.1 AlpA family phage regulatory protein [Salinivibrio sp. VYel5]OOE58618.1 transcriptional regulator [Salinivibrio sp. ML323]